MLEFETYNNSDNDIDIKNILEKHYTGMVIIDAISKDEINIFANCIKLLKDTFYTDLNSGNGYSLPGMFGQLHKTQPQSLVNNYFQNIVPFNNACENVCNFSIYQWLVQKLSSFTKPYSVEVLPTFLPYSFRVVFPKKGGLFVHKDNKLLPLIHETVSDKILQVIIPETMMSWYFTLQAPLQGGELWVADNHYADYEKDGQFEMINPEKLKISVDEMDHIKVKTPTGSLLIFNGGSYWHKVLPPSDESDNRITFGGFMAKAIDKDILYFWS